MNTVRSFWIGWGSLCIAGAGAYYFAKKDINASRQAQLEKAHKRAQDIRALEDAAAESNAKSSAPPSDGVPARTDSASSPNSEASSDPAPTRHAPATELQRVAEKSKYESSMIYRSPKGDRFS